VRTARPTVLNEGSDQPFRVISILPAKDPYAGLTLGDYESVIAPRLAVDTSLMYFASTPVV
jgi:hypothetical protein